MRLSTYIQTVLLCIHRLDVVPFLVDSIFAHPDNDQNLVFPLLYRAVERVHMVETGIDFLHNMVMENTFLGLFIKNLG